jgi:quercetin dioxygenase-like cupin family protein
MNATHIVSKGTSGVLNVLGPTIEFLSPEEPDALYCVMLGTIPRGGSVPIHSHADVESFYVLSGAVQVLSQRGDRFEWLDVKPGEFVQVPCNAKHAFRNQSSEPVVQLITTTPKLARFFREVGRPVTPGAPLQPPTPKDIEHFLRVASKFGYWNGSPAENAAVGIFLFDAARRGR